MQHNFIWSGDAIDAGVSVSILPTVSSMVPFHLLRLDNESDVHHDLFGDVVHLILALASFDADVIANGTTAFHSSS